MVVKGTAEDLDSTAIALLVATPTPLIQGQVTDIGTDGEGTVFFRFPKAAQKAEATVSPPGANNKFKVTAVNAGQAGNNITLQLLDPNAASQPLEITVDGTNITVSLETDSGGDITSIAEEVVNLINDDEAVSAIILASEIGDVSGVVTELPVFSLSGGTGGTADLVPSKLYYYEISALLSTGENNVVETGTLIGLKKGQPNKAVTTNAKAANTGSARVDRIINEFLEVILSDFRQIKVWDEHVRRVSYDRNILQATYRHWNEIPIEVFDGQNNPIESNQITVNYDDGTIKVASDTGDQDYFVTYEFDLFPARDLQAFCSLKLQELNVLGTDGTHLTSYQDIDGTPLYWDAAITLGVAAEAYKRLSVNSGLWRNALIWRDGTEGQNLASQTADYYSTLYLEAAKGLKKGHFIGSPTTAYDAFVSRGFGYFTTGGPRFREFRLNKTSTF